MNDIPATPSPPWHRQFWPWFLMSLPAAAVVAGIATLVLAIQTSDGLVVDDYYKVGLAINRQIDREQLAADLGLNALLRIDASKGLVEVTLESSGTVSEPLSLSLRHPTRARHDQVVTLSTRDRDGHYRGSLRQLAPGNWHVLLEPEGQAWRLRGRLPVPARSAARLGSSRAASEAQQTNPVQVN